MEPDALVDGLVGPGESSAQTIDSMSPQPSTSAGTLKDTTHLNGSNEHVNGRNSEEDAPEDRIAELEAELERTKEERENYASQYQALLARIQTMRTTLGNKLREDAVGIYYLCLR
jgi:predicted  nucleic acid-binding Zn-ribbon protein